MTEVLRVTGVKKSFGGNAVLQGIDLAVKKHEVVVLIGASGSGKSTLLKTINLLEQVDDGQIFLRDTDITDPRVSQDKIRARIGVVFQHYNLFPHMSVLQNVTLALRSVHGIEKREAEKRGRKLLERIGLAEKVSEYLQLVALDPQLANRRPAELSGGQRQRVAIARALILEPEVVVFDEAVSALDVTVQSQILRLLTRLQRERDITYVFISHDLAVVRQISDTVSVLQNGNQVESGLTERVFADPQHPFTKQLIAAIHGARFRDGMLNLGL